MPPVDPIDPALLAGVSNDTSAPLASGQIFLSYASRDSAIAEQVCEHLERSGIPLALDALGQRAEADKYIARAIDDEQVANAAAYQIALLYAARADKDRAFTWIERAYRQRDAGILWIKYDPLLKGLRSDPRFAALVAKVGMFDCEAAFIGPALLIWSPPCHAPVSPERV